MAPSTTTLAAMRPLAAGDPWLPLVNPDRCSSLKYPSLPRRTSHCAEYRGLPGQHPRKVSKLSPALALGAAALVFGAAMTAQAASLRQRPDTARTRPLPASAGAEG